MKDIETKNQGELVSVIVPTLNECHFISACLEALSSQSYKNMEIIVVDSHSKDGTDRLAKKYASVIYMDKLGPGAARNLGAKSAKGGIVAFTDADCIVPRDWIETIAKNFEEDPKLVALGGVQEPLEGGAINWVVYSLLFPVSYGLFGLFGLFQSSSTNCAFRKDAFLSIGGFDESVSMLEDVIISYRMSDVGKTRVEKNLRIRSSTRRFTQVGYVKSVLLYLHAYANYILKRPIGFRYFDIIEH